MGRSIHRPRKPNGATQAHAQPSVYHLRIANVNLVLTKSLELGRGKVALHIRTQRESQYRLSRLITSSRRLLPSSNVMAPYKTFR